MKSLISRRIYLIIASLCLVFVGQLGFTYYEYLQLASEKIFSPDDKVYITARSHYNTKKIGIRIYKLDSPKDYLKGLNNIHYPSADSKRMAANFFQLKGNLSNKLDKQWSTFIRGNFSYLMREDFLNSLALKAKSNGKEDSTDDFDLFPLLKGFKFNKKFEYTIGKGKYYYNYTKIPLDITKKGVYLVEGVYKNKAAYTVVIITDITF
ncbi:MAG: hypothetical protein OEV44_13735, partial [Spirochaetota bacterium]|nr:hypothetical protein [Spirochaetota bacterium]